ncbi:MAG TPA: hypothetical protein VEQ37_12035 [Actinomycetota bacterium]|nr:hypothetical protein [Actinomycetota bacterium]
MGRARKRRGTREPLELYRKIRKPMPPPERVMPDRRRELAEREAEREAREAEAPPAKRDTP